jgi:hypothetical protein
MFELKVDPKFPHHYIIGVAIHAMTSGTPGKLWLKYGPVYFTNKDVKKVKDACHLSGDKIYTDIYKMTKSDIYRLTDCTELVLSLIGLKMAAEVNQATLHHFSTEIKLPDPEKFFCHFVNSANIESSSERKKLNASRITLNKNN